MKFHQYLIFLFVSFSLSAQTLPLSDRSAAAISGTEFAYQNDSLEIREQHILTEILAGNVPRFLRIFVPVNVNRVLDGVQYSATFFTLPEYLTIGTDSDYLFIPMTPTLAQKLADTLGCLLPTRKMVDQIYRAAQVKLAPAPIPPSPLMITMPVFAQHNALVRSQRDSQLSRFPLGSLTAGHKKDIVITNKINYPQPAGRVAIYGWHKPDGTPIQPLYTGHKDTWADYSHGVRLIWNTMVVNGKNISVEAVLKDSVLSALISDEGIIGNPKYPYDQLRMNNEK